MASSDNKMLSSLRAKFIALSMGTVVLVLVIAFATVCYINHQQSETNVYTALQAQVTQAQQRYGRHTNVFDLLFDDAFSSDTSPFDGRAPQDSSDSESSDGSSDASSAQRPEIGRGSSDVVIATALYMRTSDGTVIALDDLTTASISDATLSNAIGQLDNTTDAIGFLQSLDLYYATATSNGTTYYAFADVSAASSWQTLALILLGVGLIAILILLVVNLFFSRWALRPVEQAWQQQQQFVADASHELKTPLTVILANMSILLKRPEASIASQSQWVEGTQAEAEQMQELVTDMLELARPGDMRREMARDSIDFSDLLEGELLQFESVAFENNLDLATEIQENVVIHGDAKRLTRLVSTLLDNACKYAEAGGVVDVTLKAEGGNMRLSVHNTGGFIAAEDLPHVFDRFYRADKARTRDQGSFGLGLAIAHDVATDHGGTLSVESTPEAGTTFTAVLPL